MILPHLDLEKNSTIIYYLVTASATIFAAFGLIWKVGRRIVTAIKNKYLYLENTISKINEISKEFVPNHGSSLKDILNKMQGELSRNTELTEKIATRQKWIFDNREMPIFESDEEGKCVWVNLAYLDLVKRDMHFLLGNGWKNVIASEDRDRVIHNWEACVKDGRDAEDTYSMVDVDGKTFKVFTAACKTGKYGYVGAIKVLNDK